MFPRGLPERAFHVRDIRAERAIEEREQFLTTIAVLSDSMDVRNYQSIVQWQLAMTIARNNAQKLLKRYGHFTPEAPR